MSMLLYLFNINNMPNVYVAIIHFEIRVYLNEEKKHTKTSTKLSARGLLQAHNTCKKLISHPIFNKYYAKL